MADVKISNSRQLFRKDNKVDRGEIGGDNKFVADRNTVEAIMQAAYKYAQFTDKETFLSEIDSVKNNLLITNQEHVSGNVTD